MVGRTPKDERWLDRHDDTGEEDGAKGGGTYLLARYEGVWAHMKVARWNNIGL